MHLPSLLIILVRKMNSTPKDRSLHTHAEWSGRTDQLNDPREGDDNAPTLQTKARILGRSIVDDNILDKPFAVESNKARGAPSIMVREGTDLR